VTAGTPPHKRRTVDHPGPPDSSADGDDTGGNLQKSALHFGPERSLPVALVKERLDARMVEVRARGN
jgi:hypothetical protein